MVQARSKESIRKIMMARRDQIPFSTKAKYDKYVCQQLWNLVSENHFKVIHSFIPIGSEPDIIPFIEKALDYHLQVIIPKTLPQGKLKHLKLGSLKSLQSGLFNTKYPYPEIEYSGTYDLIAVPGLAYDSKKYRLGYGGGYYDRFLANHLPVFKVGLFYPFQKISDLPVEKHDIPLDEIVSFGTIQN